MFLRIALTLLFSCFFTGCATNVDAQAPEQSAWGDRGVFVFSGVLIDVQRERVRVVGPDDEIARDCSDDEFYCLTGLNMVLPRVCRPLHQGDTWRRAEIATEVLSSETREPAGHAPAPGTPRRTVYYLASIGEPWKVYVYEPRWGVIEMYVDSTRREDLAAAARNGSIADHRMTRHFAPLVTLDPFGPCAS